MPYKFSTLIKDLKWVTYFIRCIIMRGRKIYINTQDIYQYIPRFQIIRCLLSFFIILVLCGFYNKHAINNTYFRTKGPSSMDTQRIVYSYIKCTYMHCNILNCKTYVKRFTRQFKVSPKTTLQNTPSIWNLHRKINILKSFKLTSSIIKLLKHQNQH